MAERIIQTETLTSIADSIRAKTGKASAIPIENFASEISTIDAFTCARDHVIEVSELPTENIDENAVYRLMSSFTDLYSVSEGGFGSWAAVSAAFGVRTFFHTIPTKTTVNIHSSGNEALHVYYIEDENDVFFYETAYGWISCADEPTLGQFKGFINDYSEATEDGYYLVVGAHYRRLFGAWVQLIDDAFIPDIPSSETRIVTPTKETQTVEPWDADYLSQVTVNPIPDQYILPLGTATILNNGTHDVSKYASANVNVPIPDGYIVPSGALEVTENGEHDVTNYETVSVNVENVVETVEVNGVIHKYEAGQAVSAGDFVYVYTSYGGTENLGIANPSIYRAVKLGSDHMLVAYSKGTTSPGMVFVATIDGTSKGDAVEFSSTYPFDLSVVALTDTKVLVLYRDSDADQGRAVVLTIDGTTITAGATAVFGAMTNAPSISAVALTDSKVLVAYGEYRGRGTAVVLTIDGTTITIGTAIAFDTSLCWSDVSLVALTSNKAVVMWAHADYANSSYPCLARVLTIDGTTITVGATTEYCAEGRVLSSTALTDNKVFTTYTDNSVLYNLKTGVVLSVDGTTITVGADTVDLLEGKGTAVVALTDSKVLVVEGYSATVATIDGTTITRRDHVQYAYDSGNGYGGHPLATSEGSAVIVHDGVLNLSASYLTITNNRITVDGKVGPVVKKSTSNSRTNVGIVKTGGATGETIEVYCAV